MEQWAVWAHGLSYFMRESIMERSDAFKIQVDKKTGLISYDDKREAQKKIGKMPRDASATRHRNRCQVTGRPRGTLRKFGMSRNTFRDLALKGELPGIKKASW